jgi:transposase-like protein
VGATIKKPEIDEISRIKHLESELALTQMSLLENGVMLCPRCRDVNLKGQKVIREGRETRYYSCEDCGVSFEREDVDDTTLLYDQILKIADVLERAKAKRRRGKTVHIKA